MFLEENSSLAERCTFLQRKCYFLEQNALSFKQNCFGGACCKKPQELLQRNRRNFQKLSAPKLQRSLRFAIVMPIADPRNRKRSQRQEKALLRCDLRVRWKVASDLRFHAAISEPQTPPFCAISGDLAPSTRKSRERLNGCSQRGLKATLCNLLTIVHNCALLCPLSAPF